MRVFLALLFACALASAARAQQPLPGAPLSAPTTPGVTAASLGTVFVKLNGSNTPMTGTLNTLDVIPSVNANSNLGSTAKAYGLGFVFQLTVPSGGDSTGANGYGKLTYSTTHGHLRVTGEGTGGTSTPANVLTGNDLASYTGTAVGGKRLAFYNGTEPGFIGGAGVTGDAAGGVLVVDANGTAACAQYGYFTVCGDGNIPDAVFRQQQNAGTQSNVEFANNAGITLHAYVGGSAQAGSLAGLAKANNTFLYVADSGKDLMLAALGASSELHLAASGIDSLDVDASGAAVLQRHLSQNASTSPSITGGSCTATSISGLGDNAFHVAGTCTVGQTVIVTFGATYGANRPMCTLSSTGTNGVLDLAFGVSTATDYTITATAAGAAGAAAWDVLCVGQG